MKTFFADYAELVTEIERLRKDLKPKVTALHEFEGKKDVKGFDLKSVKREELLNMGHF
jgi:hypothetical protein